jgi:hypothetical protein
MRCNKGRFAAIALLPNSKEAFGNHESPAHACGAAAAACPLPPIQCDVASGTGCHNQ